MTVTLCELENGPFEIVDFPSYSYGDFPWFFVCLPEGTNLGSKS